MNQLEAKEKLKVINNYNYAQPIQHISIIKEKELYNKRLKQRESAMLYSLERVKNANRSIYINHLRKFIDNKDITESIIEKEEEYVEYLY